MAISIDEKVDFLWKRLLFGVSKTASATDKAGSNEIIPSPITVLPTSIWQEAATIPAQPPVSDTSLVKLYTGAERIRATTDPTSTPNMTWLATEDFGDIATRLTDFIPPTFGSNYAVKVFVGDPQAAGTRIFPDTTNQEWVFDYTAGVLIFTGTIPAGVAANGIYFEVHQYVGPTGAGGSDLEDGFGLELGDDLGTDGEGAWDDGALALTATDSVSYAISKLSKRLRLAADQADLDTISADLLTLADRVTDVEVELNALDATILLLGDDLATDGLSLWDGGLVTFEGTDTTAYAVSRLNHKLAELKLQIDNYEPPIPTGFDVLLGDVAADGDGSWSPGAVPLTDTTPVSEAVDRLNEVLAKLVPSPPTDFPGATLAVSNAAGTTPRLASGVTDNSGSSTLAAGDAVTRITTAGVSTTPFGDVGPADTGTLTGLINGVSVGSRVLTGSGDNGTYTALVISDQKDFPVSTPGFWKSMDVALVLAAASVGINKAQITHTGAGNTGEIYFVRDAITAVPVLSSGTVIQKTAGTFAYSSGVPHYGTGGVLTVGASMSNLAGETYYGGADPLVISGTNSIITSVTVAFAALGITTPIARQTTTATALTAQDVNVTGPANIHASGTIQGVARNVNGASAAANIAATVVLVKRGTAGAKIDENSVTVTGLGSSPNANAAARVSTASGDKPAAAPTAWDSTTALATHEASVVAGVLKHDKLNYSTGYLPAGPDYSTGRNGAQYATFSFKRSARSGFKIVIAGTYAGVYIKLPGVSDAQPNGGGWWDAFLAYDGAGIPGETGDTNAGCALGTVMSGASGTFQITFGTESSTNATGNEILVRIKLTDGQSVTALSFTN